jgi:hypothetical protein
MHRFILSLTKNTIFNVIKLETCLRMLRHIVNNKKKKNHA